MSQAIEKARCGAKTRSGTPCRQPAGARTVHPGKGRCWLHGGISSLNDKRLKAGGAKSPYVMLKPLRELFEEFEAAADKTDATPELSLARALLASELKRARSLKSIDLEKLGRHIERISKAIKRIEDVRSAEHVSRPEFFRILAELGRVVDLVVQRLVADPELRDEILGAIREGWQNIRMA